MGEVMKQHDESVLHASAKPSSSEIMNKIEAGGVGSGRHKVGDSVRVVSGMNEGKTGKIEQKSSSSIKVRHHDGTVGHYSPREITHHS